VSRTIDTTVKPKQAKQASKQAGFDLDRTLQRLGQKMRWPIVYTQKTGNFVVDSRFDVEKAKPGHRGFGERNVGRQRPFPLTLTHTLSLSRRYPKEVMQGLLRGASSRRQ
jgi:hypothetical protein